MALKRAIRLLLFVLGVAGICLGLVSEGLSLESAKWLSVGWKLVWDGRLSEHDHWPWWLRIKAFASGPAG